MSDDKCHPPNVVPLPTLDAAQLTQQYVLLARTDTAAIEGRIMAAQRAENAALETRLKAHQDKVIAERLAPIGGRSVGKSHGSYGGTSGDSASSLRRAGMALMGIGLLLMILAWLFGSSVLGPPGLDALGPADGGYVAAGYADAASSYPTEAVGPPAYSLADASPQMFGIGLLLLIGGAVATVLGGVRRAEATAH